MARIIAIANIKGGVGKTTTTLNLAAALAERGRGVLAVDLDPQASLSLSLGQEPDRLSQAIGDSLGPRSAPILSAIVETAEHFDLVPTRHGLANAEQEIEKQPARLAALRRALEPVIGRYDYILLDCPANAGILTGLALVAANEIIVPLTADYLALRAFDWLWQIVQGMRRVSNPDLRITGVLLNMHDPRTRHAREIAALLMEAYRSELAIFSTVVRNSVRLKESALAHKSILRYAPKSEIAQIFRDLAGEIEEGVRETEENAVYLQLAHGRAALSANDRIGAYAAFRRATEIDPLLVRGWIGRAETAAEWDDRIGCWARAARLAPDEETARAGLVRAMDQVEQRSSADVPRLVTLGHFLQEIGDMTSARRVLAQACELNPDHGEARLALARATPDARQALALVRQVLDPNPNDPQAQLALAEAQQRVREEAVQLVETARAIARTGDNARAGELFHRAVELDPRNEAAWVGCGQTTRDWPRAFEFAKRALEINPENVEAQKLYRLTWMPDPPRRASIFARARRLLFGAGAAAVILTAARFVLGM